MRDAIWMNNSNDYYGDYTTEIIPTGSTKASDPGCPSDRWSAYNDKCYKLYYGKKTFNDAETTCEQAGGNLVSIHTTQPSPTPPNPTNTSYKYCGNGWLLNQDNNKCYTRVEGKKTFADASNYCLSEGGQLAFIHSADENEFILDSL
uniref:C-type lectin domain-containing protein n=1 Tax=Acrobeloides nanus TaxID=290746 RepID=A0A914E5K9_9BILA